ncbi:ABC transporter ATP-binding protein [Gracilimonas amylolytica]|uniref:ABC transporter ATP-binding protein n=1 Tax=Gracilimonas amylolytica TaxID=1749045 RepID=UPI000CD83419|nr:ABC transporter ATP-binding protein [Gracilimonas amylolytica]
MKSDTLFKLSDIRFSYDSEQLFDGLNLLINQREKVVIKGESGSGKTTLFRLLLGFETPDKGSISFKGSVYTDTIIRTMRKEVVWLPQDLNLGTGKTAELMDFIFEFQSNSQNKPSRPEIIDTLEALGLEAGTLASNFSELSTGQRQRIGLACCLLLNRKVILLDEPTSALDLESKRKVAELLLNNDRTVISTSHDPWWVEKCDRVIELNNIS